METAEVAYFSIGPLGGNLKVPSAISRRHCQNAAPRKRVESGRAGLQGEGQPQRDLHLGDSEAQLDLTDPGKGDAGVGYQLLAVALAGRDASAPGGAGRKDGLALLRMAR